MYAHVKRRPPPEGSPKLRRAWLVTALVLGVLALLSPRASAEDVIRFKDRTIDLDAYLQGYPYRAPYMDLRSNRLIYRKRGTTDQLMMLAFDPSSKEKLDPARGLVISPRDFSKRTWWGALYSPLTRSVIIQADENSDEIINLYSLDPETGVEKQLTHTSYIYGWNLSPDARRIAYVTRATKDEMSPSDVRVLDLVSGAEQVIYQDSPVRKIVWTAISWQPDAQGLLLSFNAGGDRTRGNLLYIPLDPAGAPRVLSDEREKRNEIWPLDGWLDDDEFFFASDESGVTSVYLASLAGGAPVRLTSASENAKSAAVVEDARGPQLAVVTGNPLYSVLSLIDPRARAVRSERRLDGQWTLEKAHGARAALFGSSLSIPFVSAELRLTKNGFDLLDRVTYPADLLSKIVHCDVEKVRFVTFDKLSAPGEKGALHAYLLKPKRPRPRAELRALVLSFYGGANTFWTDAEMLCNAGYYVLSPAPRGTTDFGKAFYDAAAGDWGGAETLDGFAAGKYLQRRLGIPPSRIGIFGHSRGGYDALRALTFPGSVNGIREDFRFGFGIAESGVSNIPRAARDGNISQWFSNLTGGDPAADAAKWSDRSPETHAALLSGPVLLVHGEKDQRIPVLESRSMYQTLKKLDKPVRYLELAGQGHGYIGIEAQTRYHRAVFEFLDQLP